MVATQRSEIWELRFGTAKQDVVELKTATPKAKNAEQDAARKLNILLASRHSKLVVYAPIRKQSLSRH